jgi:hypothetical protein
LDLNGDTGLDPGPEAECGAEPVVVLEVTPEVIPKVESGIVPLV